MSDTIREQKESIIIRLQQIIYTLDSERISHDTNQDAVKMLRTTKNQINMFMNQLIGAREKAIREEAKFKEKNRGLDEKNKKLIQAMAKRIHDLEKDAEKTRGLAQRVMIAEKKLNDVYKVASRHFGKDCENKLRFHVENL